MIDLRRTRRLAARVAELLAAAARSQQAGDLASLSGALSAAVQYESESPVLRKLQSAACASLPITSGLPGVDWPDSDPAAGLVGVEDHVDG